MAQAQHGSAPDIAGKNIANPAALIGSAAMLLAWLGERRSDDRLARAGAAIEAALDRVIADARTAARPISAARSARMRSGRRWRTRSQAPRVKPVSVRSVFAGRSWRLPINHE